MTKEQFHWKYKRELKTLASELGLAPSSFEVRSNKGGPAVLGEITLHGEKIYVQVGGSLVTANDKEQRVLFRSCKGRRDYCGGVNQYFPLSLLHSNRAKVASMLKACMEQGV